MAAEDDLDFGEVEDTTQFTKLKLHDDDPASAVSAAAQKESSAIEDQIAKEPNNASLHSKLANVLLRSGQVEKAMTAISKAIELQPNAHEYYAQKAHVHLDIHEAEEAFTLLNKALQLAPNDADVLYEMGHAYEVDENHAKAKEYFGKALEKKDTHVQALMKMATIHSNETDAKSKDHNQEEALKLFKKVISIDSHHAPAYFHAGVILQARNKEADLKEAATMFTKAISLKPSDGQYHARLIQCYDSLNMQKEREQAREALHKAFQSHVLNQSWVKIGRFCCAQFEVGAHFVIGYDHFQLQGADAVKYAFFVYKKGEVNEEKVLYRISVASSDEETKKALQSGEIQQGHHIYLLESHHGKDRKVFARLKDEPQYQDAKDQAIKIVNGELKPTN